MHRFVYTQPPAAFLYSATMKQRENWVIQEQGQAVMWPELGHSLLLVDQLG
jgi:hypothetical protein